MGETPARPRSSRLGTADRKPNGNARKGRYEVAGLDADAFARRTQFLRETFRDPKTRHAYQWTGNEKKMLALDWFHNPGLYNEWKPSETEDMASRLYSNLIFNYSHLAMVNIGTTVIVCRLINEFVDIYGNYQLMFMVVRTETGELEPQDSLRVGLVWRGEQSSKTIEGKEALLYSAPKSEDFQCLTEGISFNAHSFSSDEFGCFETCEKCQNRKVEPRTRLCLPEIFFKTHVVGLELTCAIVDSRRNYLATVQKVDGTVHIIDITKVLQVTLEVVHKWKTVHEEYVRSLRELKNRLEGGPVTGGNAEGGDAPAPPEKPHRGRGNSAAARAAKHCTACLLGDEQLKTLDALRQQTMDFKLPSDPITCVGLDVATESHKGVPFRRISNETCLTYIYSSIENLKVVVPVYVAAVGGSRICVWRIGDVNDGGTRQPFMQLEFPEGCRPTDVTATLGIARDYLSLVGDKFAHEPLIYATDDSGYLRLWTLGDNNCDASIQVDTNALLSVDVNKMYPNMVVIGVETGKIKIYNVWKQCMGVTGTPPDIDFVRMTTIPSYLPNDVYEYLRWYHPVVKVKWVNDTLVMAQYAEPLFARESANASTVAIWNMAKDIFDRNDAILCHRTWSQDLSYSWHLAARLVCLYGGHYASLGGVVSSDCRWSSEHGLIAISSDATGQLHVYKPGVWTWADYDDALCLARFKGDADFHCKILDKVTKEHENLMKRNASDAMASADLRKNRAKFSDFMEVALRELELIRSEKALKNDFSSLPNWAKRTLKLNTDCERLLKQIQKNLRDREITEHNTSSNRVQR
ncbi:katanin P80 subunit, putative [Babesia ovata]|uniref:Katanin P80 subunit, putative n=1 Tax=Babesia ovata TaxID=189622 RepID=A0A2H6K764_9APIC|nr:katanin P80 subunit, putative [Babesia ovata]GBE58822.1 katanin P80 subunit, putative [Babesia ovata]